MSKVPFNSRLESDLRTEFEIEMRRRGIRVIETAVEQAVRLWLQSDRVIPPQTQSQSTADNSSLSTQSENLPAKNGTPTIVPVIESETRAADLSLEIRPGDEQWVSELLFLLHHADQDTKHSIQQNIGTFARLTRAVMGAKSGQPDTVPATPIPTDRAGRMERLRELRDRSRERRGLSGGDQAGVPPKKGKDTPPTGTGGRH